MNLAAPAPSVALRASLHGALIDSSRAGIPNEACGLIAGDAHAHEGGRPTRFLPLPNAAGSPYRYLIDPRAQLAAMLDVDDRGEVVWGIFHSHVASPAAPSATDIGLAFYPDSLYVICSLASDPPGIRAWSIREGDVAEVLLQVE